MLITLVNVIFKLCSLGLVIAAGGLWAGAGVETRPKYRDDQTLVGGAIWSQTIIPVGLMISKLVDAHLDLFVHAYFVGSGILILWATGGVLITGECRAMKRARRHRQRIANLSEQAVHPSHMSVVVIAETYDKIYFTIGVLAIMASTFKICELLMLFV